MPDIPSYAKATNELLSVFTEGRFEYVLVGGLAVILQGYDRLTRDVDALVWDLDERLDEFMALAEAKGFRVATPGQLQGARSTRVLHLTAADGTAVDILLGLVPFEREVIDRAQSMALQNEVAVKVGSPEDLIIMKLIASRDRDNYDITALLELYPEVDKARIRRIVEAYAEALEKPEIIKNLQDRLG